MNKGELFKLLENIPDDTEIKVLNCLIEDDESCPTFEICGGGMEESEKKEKIFILEFMDSDYIREDCCMKP